MSKILKRKMAEAESYEQWKEAAIAYDEKHGLQKWKDNDSSHRYDYKAIRNRLNILKDVRKTNDNSALLFNLNEGIHGNLGGMGSSSLYRKAKFGTKQLVIDFVDETNSALEHLAKPRIRGINMKEKMDFFHRAHLCYGQSALMFSGSGTYVFFHVGVLKTLWEQDLIPQIISGASGGALIAAVAGSRKKEALGEIFTSEFLSFEEELRTIMRNLTLGKKRQTRQKDLISIVERIIPDMTFEEAYQVSGLKINISIAPYETHQKSRLLNAITSPNVMLREAVLASCCIPGVFRPVRLAARDVNGERVPYLPQRKWVDGSLSADLPMKQLSRLFGVNHFIVSQTNPLVLPFLQAEKAGKGLIPTLSKAGLNSIKSWGLASSELMKGIFKNNPSMSRVLNSYTSLISQTYTGDINILPSGHFINPIQALSARSSEQVLEMINDGERATWPMVERIRIQTKVSRTLNRLVEELEQSMINQNRRKATAGRKQAQRLTLIEKDTNKTNKSA